MSEPLKPLHDPRVELGSAYLNGHLYGYIYGHGSPGKIGCGTIILIHGFPDLSFGWRYQIPYFKSLGYDCIAIDCLGYGRSDAPPTSNMIKYGFKRCADDIAELCRQLHLSSVILGGHDWGGAIAYRTAQYHPNLIRGIFSICTPYFAPEPTYLPHELLVATRLPNFRYQLEYASGVMEQRIRGRYELRQYLSGSFLAETPNGRAIASAHDGMYWDNLHLLGKSPLVNDEEMDFYIDEYSRHGLDGPLNYYRNREVNFMDEYRFFFKDGNNLDAKPTVDQEVLFIRAGHDNALPPSMSDHMKDYIPNLTIKDFEDYGHWVHWQRPKEVNEVIHQWLKEKKLSTLSWYYNVDTDT